MVMKRPEILEGRERRLGDFLFFSTEVGVSFGFRWNWLFYLDFLELSRRVVFYGSCSQGSYLLPLAKKFLTLHDAKLP